MNTSDRSHPRTVTAPPVRLRSLTDEPHSTRRRPQLIFDAVVAGYIHDISDRHRPQAPARPRG
jgi:hypothetical protein